MTFSLVEPALLLRLEDDDAAVRRLAVIELADEFAGEPDEAAPLLAARLREDRDAAVRAEAARRLEGFDGAIAGDALADALLDADAAVRDAAAISLAELRSEAVGALLLRRLEPPRAAGRAALLRALRE
ncbi:MAG: hypothetical protein QM661_15130, partial [Solimonas sp.]